MFLFHKGKIKTFHFHKLVLMSSRKETRGKTKMRFIKQYPHISTLLIFSTVLFFIGVYVAVLKYAIETGTRSHGYSVAHDPPPPAPYRGRNGGGETRPVLVAAPVSRGDYSNPPVTVIKEVGKAKATYYSGADNTITQTEYFPLRKIGNGEFTMVAFFENEGFTLRMPDMISLRMFVMSKDDRYATNRKFRVFLDGKLAFETDSKLESSEKDNGIVNTALLQDVPYSLFVKMSRSKVRLQIGETFVELTNSDVESFRDLVKLVES